MEPNENIPQSVLPIQDLAFAAPAAEALPLKSGMYWRRSKLFGWLCPTGILTLEASRLRFVTEKETVFDAPVSSVSASFSGWGTLTITVDGSSYDFIGSGGGMAGSFSASQKTEIAQAAGKYTSGAFATAGVVAPAGAAAIAAANGIRAIGALGALVGSSIGAGVYASGVNILKKWPAVLEAQGASVRAKKPNYMWWFFGALGAILLVALVIGLIVS
jgi:hypothetical protein